MSWQALAEVAPDLATFGAERLHDQVAYLATLKSDGAPRLHPVRPVVTGGRLFVFTEKASPKVRDLERDPRYALHGTATRDQPWDLREFAVEGNARRIADSDVRAAVNAGSAFPRDEQFVLFELAVNTAMSTVYGPDGKPRRQHWRAP
jgi:predicted pyridoxine 5'-phosphate oxidase superfamily flavin-nucleotide-binding protein